MANTRLSHWALLTVDIDVDDDLTDAFDARPGADFGLIVPSNFDGTAITFLVSHDNITYTALYDTSNAAVGMTVAASRNYQLPASLVSWPWWKIKTTTAQTTNDTIFTVVAK